MDTIAELGTILSVWAHPDDETYLAGAVMAAARDLSQRVVCVSATAGELGTNDPTAWPPSRLGDLRRSEAAAAMAVLGVVEHRFLGLPDGSLSEYTEAGVHLVGALIDEVAPDTILTFGSDGITFHPDHIAVGAWVTAAWDGRGRPCRLLHAVTTRDHLARFGRIYDEAGVYMTDARPDGVALDALAVHLVAEGAALERKLSALAAMPSQTRQAIDAFGLDLYCSSITEEAFVDADAWQPRRAAQLLRGTLRRVTRRSRHAAPRRRSAPRFHARLRGVPSGSVDVLHP